MQVMLSEPVADAISRYHQTIDILVNGSEVPDESNLCLLLDGLEIELMSLLNDNVVVQSILDRLYEEA